MKDFQWARLSSVTVLIVLHASLPSEPLSIIQPSVKSAGIFLYCSAVDNSVTHILSVTSWETGDTALDWIYKLLFLPCRSLQQRSCMCRLYPLKCSCGPGLSGEKNPTKQYLPLTRAAQLRLRSRSSFSSNTDISLFLIPIFSQPKEPNSSLAQALQPSTAPLHFM